MKTIVVFFAVLMLASCEDESLRDYSTDPPTKHADYLTYVAFEKTIKHDGQWYTDTYYRREVLQFNPSFTGDRRWNTLHFNPPLYSAIKLKYHILYWTELPIDPVGTSFEATSGTLSPPTK